MRRSGQATLMQPLFEQVENHYVNSYLLRLNDAWQKHVDAVAVWAAEGVLSQRDFYVEHVGDFRRRNQRICVIVSDALRYEVAEELLKRIRNVDRYEADNLSDARHACRATPSSAWPRCCRTSPGDRGQPIQVKSWSMDRVRRDSKTARSCSRTGDPAIAPTPSKRKRLWGSTATSPRALLSANDVLYIYHDQIDASAHPLTTEVEAFDAAEQAIEEIIRLVKKLTGANASNIIVTADHGFSTSTARSRRATFPLQRSGASVSFIATAASCWDMA